MPGKAHDQNKNTSEATPKPEQNTPLSGGTPHGPVGELFEQGVFPAEWALIPVKGKDTYEKNWASERLSQDDAIVKFKTDYRYAGLGVVTGEFSGGLIALDVDGFSADERFRRVAGEAYEELGQESTMSWTSGKPGRRQILWRVPQELVPQLRNVTTLVCLEDGTWEAGRGGAPKRGPDGRPIETLQEATERCRRPDEELVLRFNRCQSVLPGSPHPETKKRFRFLNYNGGKVEPAPMWVLNVLRKFAQPVAWLAADDIRAIKSEVGHTLVPPKQLRGWFFKPEVQKLLMPRLEELVFKHPTFDHYGWDTREGSKPQRQSGCPWHQSTSGTAFQYDVENGLWCCHACGVGGDPLDFIHKIETHDMHAERPIGAELERYIQPIAEALGFKYPDDLLAVQRTTEVPRLQLSSEDFFKELQRIERRNPNPATCLNKMADLALQTGRRLSGIQCQELLREYEYYKYSDKRNKNDNWSEYDSLTYMIPNLIAKPSQILLHSAPGLGKTSTAMGLAAAVLYGKTFMIRGIKHKLPVGRVLWIQNDQSPAKFKRDCEDNKIEYEEVKNRFFVKTGFQINHLHRLRTWILEYKPDLVVVDSIGSCSSRMTIAEKDKAFANPFYELATMNGNYSATFDKDYEQVKADLREKYPKSWNDGDPDKEYQTALDEWLDNNLWRASGFPATAFVWIHHDNAQGEARGTRYLPAAMDEQWHLRHITDQERLELQEKGLPPGECRFIQIKKSRVGREGDRLIVQRGIEGDFNLQDFTPCERRSDHGHGDPEPSTMALRIVRDTLREVREGRVTLPELQTLKPPSGGQDERGMTTNEVYDQLNDLLLGQGREPVSVRTVRRWLVRWAEEGVLLHGKPVLGGARGNKKAPTFVTPLESSRDATTEGFGNESDPLINVLRSSMTPITHPPSKGEGFTEDTDTVNEWLSSIDLVDALGSPESENTSEAPPEDGSPEGESTGDTGDTAVSEAARVRGSNRASLEGSGDTEDIEPLFRHIGERVVCPGPVEGTAQAPEGPATPPEDGMQTFNPDDFADL